MEEKYSRFTVGSSMSSVERHTGLELRHQKRKCLTSQVCRGRNVFGCFGKDSCASRMFVGHMWQGKKEEMSSLFWPSMDYKYVR